MKIAALLFLLLSVSTLSAQSLIVTGDAKLIADFSSEGESPNVKGEYLEKYQTLVSYIEGTKTVKCMVRVANTVNVVGVWEMNDPNDVRIKAYEVVNADGKNDILLLSFMDEKALSLNLFRLKGEELIDLGYNYLEQQVAGQPVLVNVSGNRVTVTYDNGVEKPVYGILNDKFEELEP